MYQYQGSSNSGHEYYFKCTERAYLEILTLVKKGVLNRSRIKEREHCAIYIAIPSGEFRFRQNSKYYLSFTELSGVLFSVFLLEEYDCNDEEMNTWIPVYEYIPPWFYNEVDQTALVEALANEEINREEFDYLEQFKNHEYMQAENSPNDLSTEGDQEERGEIVDEMDDLYEEFSDENDLRWLDDSSGDE